MLCFDWWCWSNVFGSGVCVYIDMEKEKLIVIGFIVSIIKKRKKCQTAANLVFWSKFCWSADQEIYLTFKRENQINSDKAINEIFTNLFKFSIENLICALMPSIRRMYFRICFDDHQHDEIIISWTSLDQFWWCPNDQEISKRCRTTRKLKLWRKFFWSSEKTPHS